MTDPAASIDHVQRVVRQFQHMVERDGGQIELVSADHQVIRVRYAAGTNDACASCVLEPDDLAELMSEAFEAQGGAGRFEVVSG